MSLAPVAYLLYQNVMTHDPSDPSWLGRDRFVLSCGHSSLTQYIQLYLSGYGLQMKDLEALRTWGSLGVFEMLCAVLLVVPAAAKWMPVLTLLAAAALALESLALAVWFARYSLALRATNPLVYVVVGGLIAAFVAYGRYTLRPLP